MNDIRKFNQEKREEIASELERIRDQIESLNNEAQQMVRNEWPSEIGHADAYVFEQIGEHLDCANRYNSSYTSMMDELRCTSESGSPEPIEDFGESWEEDEDEDSRATECGGCGARGSSDDEGTVCTTCRRSMMEFDDTEVAA